MRNITDFRINYLPSVGCTCRAYSLHRSTLFLALSVHNSVFCIIFVTFLFVFFEKHLRKACCTLRCKKIKGKFNCEVPLNMGEWNGIRLERNQVKWKTEVDCPEIYLDPLS